MVVPVTAHDYDLAVLRTDSSDERARVVRLGESFAARLVREVPAAAPRVPIRIRWLGPRHAHGPSFSGIPDGGRSPRERANHGEPEAVVLDRPSFKPEECR